VTVCGATSLLSKSTSVPRATVSAFGENASFSITTADACSADGAASDRVFSRTITTTAMIARATQNGTRMVQIALLRLARSSATSAQP
jgi:hypothetical protein